MPAARADLAVSSRWILPMTSPEEVLENRTLIVRDGRIIDVLPSSEAKGRYAATVNVERSTHLVLPGLVNACTQIAPARGRANLPERLHDGARLRIAEMLKSGTTCFCALGVHPDIAARTAAEQGMRALIGMPIAESASPWAAGPAEYLTRALEFRDEYRDHPAIATAFAPLSQAVVADGTLARIATLAAELDAGILMSLHESHADVARSIAAHGVRPIERLQALGLLTPALTALHMAHVNGADIALAQRGGVSLALCPQAGLLSGDGCPPVASWAASGLRLGVGSGAAGADLWTDMRFLALLSRTDGVRAALPAWDALAAATRGAAAALGLDAEIGSLQPGKWADLCCIDLEGPAMHWIGPRPPYDPVSELVFNGGRDLVSDVWVAGRHLLNDRAFTRLDWPDVSARVHAWREPPLTGVR
jgi:5-methylthioadenosine/S-adenosylhomocysteine deaminase